MTLFRNRWRIESARKKDWNYAGPGWYFITLCTARRARSFGFSRDGRIELTALGLVVQEHWIGIPLHYENVLIDDFVIMPNHIHGVVVIGGKHEYSPGAVANSEPVPKSQLLPSSPGSIIASYKAGVARWASKNGFRFAWQSRFHDRIIRGNASLAAIRDYIRNNPVNWIEDEYFEG